MKDFCDKGTAQDCQIATMVKIDMSTDDQEACKVALSAVPGLFSRSL